MIVAATREVDLAVARCDAWLDTLRGPDGYGGPVAHWWQQSLTYTGTGRDWRYEGIIAGYLQLWERTRDPRWLRKARRAGDDLVAGQLADGHFAASAFELNPASGGTPHEAACDVGLLLLALALRSAGEPTGDQYAGAAERNLRAYYVAQLWDADAAAFRDSPNVPSFVPNKAATAAEAMFLLAEFTGDSRWAEAYAMPTLGKIADYQVRDGGRLDGAIAQNAFGRRTIEKYFPIYIARCVPALLRGYAWRSDERFLDLARRAMSFVSRWQEADGSFPTVVYPNGRVNRYPSWIAPLGDVLRAAHAARPHGFAAANLSATAKRLLAGQDASGAIQTARGFAAQSGGRPTAVPDLRDVLHVAGWCDKAFRYFASQVGPILPEAPSAPADIRCTFRGQELRMIETAESLEVTHQNVVRYRWRKGQPWAETTSPEFWLR